MQRSFLLVPMAALALAASACGPMGPLNAEARDTWSHTYTLSKTGEVSITNVNGRIEIDGTDGTTVEVQAERIARAATDQMAHDLLPRIPINDRSTPDAVVISTGRIDGILIGASYSVTYHVKAPRTAMVRATTVNGGVRVHGLSGRTVARATNGGISADDMAGSLEGRTVNGGVRAQFAALGEGEINLATVNGGIRVNVPETAKATVSATWVNGGFNTVGLKLDVRESGKRHFDGLLNGGGAQITVTTVNGGVSLGAGKSTEGDDLGDVIEKTIEKSIEKSVDKSPKERTP